ncbi:MAG: tetratricopeptide repeat protein [Balneolales bacterium]
MSQQRIAKLQEFLNEDSNDSFSRFALALEHLKLDDVNTARSHFEYIRDHHPGYVGVYYHLGKLYQQSGEHKKASTTFIAGISVAQNENDLHAASELEQALKDLNEE